MVPNPNKREIFMKHNIWQCQVTCSTCGTQIDDVRDINKYATINEDKIVGTCCNDHEDGFSLDMDSLDITHEEVDEWTFSELMTFMYYSEGVDLEVA
jgi:hypothetical protein